MRFEEQHLLSEAIRSLSPKQREVILLRFIDGRSPRWIAKELNLPVQTIYKRQKRALAELRQKLDSEYGGDRQAWVSSFVPLARAGKSTFSLNLLSALSAKPLAIALVAVIGVSGWLSLRIPSFTPEEKSSKGPEAQTVDQGSSQVAPNALPLAELSTPSQATVRQGIEANLVPPSELQRVRVRVVNEARGGEVSGAQVVILTSMPMKEGSPHHGRWLLRNLEDAPDLRTDENGSVDVPYRQKSFEILARAKIDGIEHQGRQLVRDAEKERVEIQLFPVRTVVVRVVDFDRQPLGDIPVALRGLQQGFVFPLLSAVTEPTSGLARFTFPDGYWTHQLERLTQTRLALDFPLVEPVELELDAGTDVFEFVCPPVGTLDVGLELDKSWTTSGWDDEEWKRASLFYRLPNDASGRTMRISGPRVHCFPIGLDVEVEVNVRLPGAFFDITRSFRGPTYRHEVRRADFSLDCRRIPYQGKLIDEAGEPWSNAEFLGNWKGTDSPSKWNRSRFSTDSKGEFKAYFMFQEGASVPRELHLYGTDSSMEGSSKILVPSPNEEGVHDLGTVVHLGLRPFLQGRVVDEQGQPIAGSLLYRLDEADPFTDLGPVLSVTDEQGRFEIWEDWDGESGYLFAKVDGSKRHRPILIQESTQESLGLVVREGSTLLGTVVVEPHSVRFSLALGLRPADSASEVPWRTLRSRTNEPFSFTALKPGVYDLALFSSLFLKYPVIIENIVAPKGETRHEKLNPIVLEAYFHVIPLEIRDSIGRRKDAKISVRLKDGVTMKLQYSEGHVWIPKDIDADWLLVHVADDQRFAFPVNQVPPLVKLAETYDVGLQWRGEDPRSPLMIKIVLTPKDHGLPVRPEVVPHYWDQTTFRFREGEKWQWGAIPAGAYRVHVFVSNGDEGLEADVSPKPPQWLEVEKDGLNEFSIQLPMGISKRDWELVRKGD